MSMKRCLCHSGHTARSCLGHIWVSDNVLDAAIQRFGRLALAKRNVSLVPGPLEARKRETKRRLAYISQVNGGTWGSFDPSLIDGINERAREGQWHWKAPGMSGLPESIPLIPWLGDLIHHTTAPPAPARQYKSQVTDAKLLEEHQDIGNRLQEHAFLSRLNRCKTLDELRDLASFFEIDVRKHSSIAFRQLYRSQKSLRSCLDFLEDMSLDDPYAQNLGYLLAELLQQLKYQNDADPARMVSVLRGMLVPWVESQLSLGKRSRTDIEELSVFIVQLARLKPFGLFKLDIARAVLKGLRSSTVLGFRDLVPADRFSLLNSVMSGELTLELQDLGLSLIETITNAAHVSLFLAKTVHSGPAIWGLQEVQAWQMDVSPRICNYLQSLSQADRSSVIRITSKILVAWQSKLTENSLLCAGLMDQWWSTIAKVSRSKFWSHGVGSLKIEYLMPSDRLDMLASYANHLGGPKKARFVLSNWFVGRLSPYDFENLSNDVRENLEKEIHDPPFLCMLRIVHERGFLQHGFIRHSFELLTRMRMFGVIIKIMTRAKTYDIHIPQEVVMDTIRQFLTISPKEAYLIFRCDPRIPLEELPSLAVALIEYPGVHASIVWHYHKVRPWPPTSSPKIRTQFLDEVALAYSKSSKLTARMARTQVTKCMKCYSKENLGPLSPQISQALVRTGIIRPLQEKRRLSHDQLTWVLSVVREVEGPKRADEIDRVLFTWREQLWKQDNPKGNIQLFRRGKRKRKRELFKTLVKWCKNTRRYVRVTSVCSSRAPADAVAMDHGSFGQVLQAQPSHLVIQSVK